MVLGIKALGVKVLSTHVKLIVRYLYLTHSERAQAIACKFIPNARVLHFEIHSMRERKAARTSALK